MATTNSHSELKILWLSLVLWGVMLCSVVVTEAVKFLWNFGSVFQYYMVLQSKILHCIVILFLELTTVLHQTS